MEANFFRFLAVDLAATLTGLRFEKIHGPAQGVLVFTLHGQGRTEHLIFRPAKSAGLLFLSPERPANPPAPPTRVMWLRKRLTGRRLLESRIDWPNQRLGFLLSPRELPAAGNWAVFDLRASQSDGLTLDGDFTARPDPAWPPLERILDSLHADAEIWREYPQITPLLRKRLSALAMENPPQAARLLARLAQGVSDSFFLPPAPLRGETQAIPPLAWDPGLPGTERFASSIEAATAFGQRTLFPQIARAEDHEQVDQAVQQRKRLKRQEALLDQDEARHQKLAGLAKAAEALQIALSGLKTTPQQSIMQLEHPEHGLVEVPLDPRLTPAENMAHLFRQAAKGRRGLAHVERRRAELATGTGPELHAASSTRQSPPSPRTAPVVVPKRYQGLAVALFRTSDGFLVLRGKSSQANHDMLTKAAGPYDLWFHVSGGPSAHVILKRDFPDQDVPEQSLLEAAGLCALKSFRKDDAKAEVLCAKVRDVRKVKGAAIGSVAVDQVDRTLLVSLDPGLETRLALK
ncbi:NFACT RNA binding domain-containing protein [Humidesulfovibrio sp.]|uniref:NFACT RNA binding domain-containing protein n=1 Tax=Humidesulfovibrio sp. TaxID=2910988 RepID=UPI0035BE4685